MQAKLFYYFLIISTLQLSCTDGQADIRTPENFTKEEIVSILADVHIADAYLAKQKRKDNRFMQRSDQYYGSLFKKHHIDREKFEAIIRFYADKPKDLEKLYDGVLEQLRAQSDSIKIEDSREIID